MFYKYRKRTRDFFVGVFVELCNMLHSRRGFRGFKNRISSDRSL